MNPLESLRDIHGLMPVSRLPLAPGWWVIMAIVSFFLICSLGLFIYRRQVARKKPSPDWRETALMEWTLLTTESFPPKEQLTRLAILLRRVAMQRHGRVACAGLTGEPWLIWLTAHDPQGFNWQQNGQFLCQFPYMPSETIVTEEQLQTLCQAIRVWID